MAAEKGSSGEAGSGKTAGYGAQEEGEAAVDGVVKAGEEDSVNGGNAGMNGSGESGFRWKTQDSIHILLFITESCNSCEKAKEYLAGLPTEAVADGRSYPVELGEISVMEEDNAEYLMELYDSYQVPPADQKVPVVFIGTRYLAGEKQIRSGRLEEYINALEGLGALYLPSDGKPADGDGCLAARREKASKERFLSEASFLRGC